MNPWWNAYDGNLIGGYGGAAGGYPLLNRGEAGLAAGEAAHEGRAVCRLSWR